MWNCGIFFGITDDIGYPDIGVCLADINLNMFVKSVYLLVSKTYTKKIFFWWELETREKNILQCVL